MGILCKLLGHDAVGVDAIKMIAHCSRCGAPLKGVFHGYGDYETITLDEYRSRYGEPDNVPEEK